LKILKFVLIFIVAAAIFYFAAIFLGANLPKPAFLEKGIEGNTELKVTLLMDNNVKNPLPNVEIDLAQKPGQPPKGGTAITDESGVATFKVKPGDYYVYFNENTFPQNLKVPELVQIVVEEGVANEKTILVTTSK
jgi:hypothetical protein